MIFGLTSSGWASDWPLDQLLAHAIEADLLGVELRLGDGHGVGMDLDDDQREQVRQTFTEAGIELIGLGTGHRVDHADEDEHAAAVELIHEAMRLSHDVGGVGVTVAAHEPPRGDAVNGRELLGKRLRELATFAERWGQQVRVEMLEACAEPATARAVFQAADHHNVYLAWASEPANISSEGLEHDFSMLRPHLGETVYIGPLDDDAYPYFDLLQLLNEADYLYWVLLRTDDADDIPDNVADVLNQQHRLFARILDPSRDTQIRIPR